MPSTSDPLAALSFAPIDPSNPNTLLYTPQPQNPLQKCSTENKADLKVIILATWLGGASAGRIAVYCRGYQAAYPAASILLIRTVLSDITITTFAVLQAQLQPARDFLLSAFPPESSQTEVGALLHMFSHGGCNTALQLSRLLRGNIATAPFPIPLVGVVLDSCPGSSGFVKAYSGAIYSLPAVPIPGVHLLGRACLFPVIGTISLLQAWGMVSSVEDLRRELNNPNTFGLAPRLYLHSKGDRLVAAEDVASHAAEIGTRVPFVVRELWEVAEHVALPLEDSERYWGAVRCFVDGSIRMREAKL